MFKLCWGRPAGCKVFEMRERRRNGKRRTERIVYTCMQIYAHKYTQTHTRKQVIVARTARQICGRRSVEIAYAYAKNFMRATVERVALRLPMLWKFEYGIWVISQRPPNANPGRVDGCSERIV